MALSILTKRHTGSDVNLITTPRACFVGMVEVVVAVLEIGTK
jgi:hypothetical protein